MPRKKLIISLYFSFLFRQFEFVILIRQNEILTNDSIVSLWQFAVQGTTEKYRDR